MATNNSIAPPSFFTAVDSLLLSDKEIRTLARSWLEFHLAAFNRLSAEEKQSNIVQFAQSLKEMPIALHAEATSQVQYEIPTEFFRLILGKRLKYSSSYFPKSSYTLDQAEEAMLELYFDRAQIRDGQSVLDLGGGWGAFAIFIAEKCPSSQITSISYSESQMHHIQKECRERGISNVKAINADIITMELKETYDRILCIELLEHMKNYTTLLKKISGWMKPDGLLFIEIFTHKLMAIHLEDIGDGGAMSWLSAKFFPGATLPSNTLILYFQDHVSILDHWVVNGNHYAIGCDAGLKKMDDNMHLVRTIFTKVYGKENAEKNIAYWRVFHILFSEIFRLRKGEEYMVSHYLFTKKFAG